MNESAENPRHSRWAWATLAVLALGIVIAVISFLAGGGGDSGQATAAADPSGAPSQVSGSPAAIAALGQIRKETSEPLLEGGKPSVFFMGAEWCPYCASERWALVEATSRFGSWKELGELRSRPGQGNYPGLPTYDLSRAVYSSDYLALSHKEVATVDGEPLQSLGSFETQLVDEYDKAGSIPFLFASGSEGRYTVDLAYSPSLLEGQTFAALHEDVAAGASTPAAEAIAGEADAITALLCRLDGQRPAKVCTGKSIVELGRGLE